METVEGTELCVPQLNSSCRKPTHSRSTVMLIYVLLSSISLITVALNLLVIISISHFRQLHTPTNLLLLSLAVSDLLVGLLLMPVEIIYIEACWFLGNILCTLYYIIDYIITSASVANMVLIALDRYLAVCDPLLYPTKVTKSTAYVCVSLCWIGSVFYRLLLLHDHLVKPGVSVSCFGECVVVISNIAGTIDMIFTFIMPITVIICLYFKVFVVALSQARMLRSQITAAAAKPGLVAVRRNEMKAARTLGIVVVVFLFCFCPYFFSTLEGTDTVVNASSAAFEIWLSHFNSCLNPVIYAFFYPWFRKSIKLIVSLQILKPGSSDIKILH
ncbi:trace amine-associated receptor 13c-like [Xiphophorus couchianus]|uniref:trace amine-associated receptor 13c-like n=1 Tax=Xiphophorus couchianus TaxID=32473 RepID=UPI0010160A2E|nr:trace amine-associated receptor 13c-like [Xiphophorus couchianus]